MPEAYPGQAAIIADHLAQEEALLAANQEQLKATTDPIKRADILRLIAGQSGQVGARRRALQKALAEDDTARTESVRLWFAPDEKAALREKAEAAGQSLAQFIRTALGY